MLLMLISCQQDAVTSGEVPADEAKMDHYVPGKAVVMVTEALAERLEAGQGTELIAGATARRTFSHGGRYEERMRKEGLHLWYDVEFDESAPLTKAGDDLSNIDGVEFVEYVPVMVFQDETPVFNDPDLRKQWHYRNAGNPVTGLVEGCDINVTPAWEKGIVGSEKVVVAVIDSGVDVNHEDLKDNIWQGTDENGKTINGYNAILGNSNINPEAHGTHVAGTIAAVNNNGIGVSGIAGGNAAAGIKGVRIMSCEIFEGDNLGNEADALVWAANHGAVIAQNSWGYLPSNNLTDSPEYIKKAIDYFNTYAGCDEDGNQLPDSPMKGGVAIFAAGNDALQEGYPASYEGCVAVSSVAGDYELAYYSNYGDWVDIIAPGGDAAKGQEILSTIPDNGYGRMQGTSMACPHVSGVAALILSEFGGQGFTRQQLIDRLLKTAADISLPAKQMGHGLVDASAAVAHYGEHMPNIPEFAEYEELSGTALTLKYIMPEENEGVRCASVDLYWSEEPFEQVTESLSRITLKTVRMSAGDTLVFTVEGLSKNTEYHFAAASHDFFGYASGLSESVSVTTRDNLPPVIEALDGTEHTFRQYMWTKLKFRVSDPENALEEVRYENATSGEEFSHEDGLYYLIIDAKKIPAGSYASKIVAVDNEGKSAECTVSFVVEENIAPVQTSVMADLVFSSKSAAKTLNLSEYFKDDDGETLKYTVTSSDESVVKVSVAKENLTLTAAKFGETVITVTAEDAMAAKAVATFRVLARDGSREYDLYPNPVTDGKLYVRASEASEAELKIVGSSGAVVYESNVVPDPFSPAVEDISALLPGVYSVQVTGKSGKVFTQNIVKL